VQNVGDSTCGPSARDAVLKSETARAGPSLQAAEDGAHASAREESVQRALGDGGSLTQQFAEQVVCLLRAERP